MFGYVTVDYKELTPEQQDRYQAIYCGICRQIKARCGQASRLCLSYDMTFLALLLTSLYEPEEQTGKGRCLVHPLRRRPWTDADVIRYCADMNVALAYYNCLDDWNDDRNLAASTMAKLLEGNCQRIEAQWPRQYAAIGRCIRTLAELERNNCANPDEPASCFGELMGELLVFREDLWAPTLREMGMSLGRFIYLADAAVDFRKDKRKGKYNPFLAMGSQENWPQWEEYLVLDMSRCTHHYEKLPLVQDKKILDNILYSGIWINFGKLRKEAGQHERSV